MWTHFHDRLHQVIRQRELLVKHQRVLMAVSGGQDSLCLARLFLDLQPKWGWQLAIAHCNHRWREDAFENADYVRSLAESWCCPYYGLIAEVIPSSEASARQWRYEALAKLAEQKQFSALVTGHTASDRAETLLYNLMRGSGSDGLQALVWRRSLTDGVELVRPLLDFTRSETREWCESAQLKIWHDSTNQDWHYVRNRIRQELLPYLEEHFNPRVEQHLAQTAEVLQAEVAYLDAEAERLYQMAIAPSSDYESYSRINRKQLASNPLALQRRVMRRWLQQCVDRTPNFTQIEKVVALITAPNRSQTDPFPGGAIAKVDGDWICLDQP